ncbi:ATP-binding protein [Microbacterium sp. NPDC055903]
MRARLLAVLLVPLIALMLSLGSFATWSVAHSVQQTFYAEQLGDLAYFATSARQALRSGSATVIEGEAERFREVYGAEAVVFDLSGGVLAAGGDEDVLLGDEAAEQVGLALSGRRAEVPDTVFPWVAGESFLVEPVFDEGDVIGAVMISADADAPRSAIVGQMIVLALVATGSILLGVLLALRLARWVLAPVRRLDQAMVAIERGDMEARVAEDTGPPELRRMTRVFNGMAGEIERVVARQQEFAMNASHELRNPLNALLLRVENLATGLGPEWRDEVDETREEGRRMTRILETLLGLARNGRGDSVFSAVDVAALVEGRAAAWRDVAAQRGVLVRRTGPAMVLSVTDRSVVESALDAVIDNAVKFSPEGTTVELDVVRDEGACRIAVRDSGPGLSEEQVARVADRFWRSAESADVPGSGLGLAIATELLASIDGRLEVEAPKSGGLTVTLVIEDGMPQ